MTKGLVENSKSVKKFRVQQCESAIVEEDNR